MRRIELSHERQTLILVRQDEKAPWLIETAAMAPADPDRVNAALARWAALDGKSTGAGAAVPPRPPVTLRLKDGRDRTLAQAAFWSGAARRLPDGWLVAIPKPPALPLWPSAWSSVQPPRLDPSLIVKAERLMASGPVALSDAATADIAAMLGRLSAGDFAAGSAVDWAGARLARVTLVDGTVTDLAQVPDGEGRYYLRLASDTRADVRATRKLAFRVSEPLP